jgi:hypothetical protein
MTKLAIVAFLALAGPASAQTVVDQVIFRFGGEIVTQLDVRQARMLKLVDAAGDADQAYVDALVNRRLILADLKRTPPPDPPQSDIDARRQQWPARVGAAANFDDLLARAGMSDAALRGWIRDDLRIQAYLTTRFADRAAERDSWLSMLRQRVGLK